MSVQKRWYQVSKCSFLVVLLLAFPLLPSARAVADVPPPYTDCTGATVTPQEYQEVVARMEAVAAAYENLFASYGYCDELPLYIEGLPATCAQSMGWRDFWGDAEEFSLEPLYIYMMDVDALLQYVQIDPATEATLRARDFHVGVLGGVVSTVQGEAGLYGSVQVFSDDTGQLWTYWYVEGDILPADVAGFRRALTCAQEACYYNPKYKTCFSDYSSCVGPAQEAYNDAVDNANYNWNLCAGGTFVTCVGFVACLFACPLSGPLAPVCAGACLAEGLAFCAALTPSCGVNYNFAMRNANRQWQHDLADCQNAFNKCKGAIDGASTGGTGDCGATAAPVQVVQAVE